MGIRYVVFTQGCPHHCPGCQNPETWSFDGGEIKDTADIIKEFSSNPLLDGITLSGGEPFKQREACTELAKAAHERGLSVWCYTGYTYEKLFVMCRRSVFELLNNIDVLVDGRFEQDKKSLDLHFKGSSNQRIFYLKDGAIERVE